MSSAPTDVQLLERAAGGDARAFATFVERHTTSLHRFGTRMCGDRHAAADAVQEGLLAAWREARSFRGDASPRTWLFSVVLNACRHLRRKRVGEPSCHAPMTAAEQVVEGAAGPEAMARSRELTHVLEGALASLEPDAREVVMLRDIEGFSGDEVARLLGVSLEAMKSRLHRARLALKHALEAKLGHPMEEAL